MARTLVLTLAGMALALNWNVPTSASEDEPVVSPDLQPGQSYSVTFNETRLLDYHCHPHPWMLAQIEVRESSGRASKNWTVGATEPAGQDFDAWNWNPPKLVIEVGDTVTWTNNGTVMHKVQETTAEHRSHVGTVGEGHADAEEHPAGGHSDEHASSKARVERNIPWYGIPVLFTGFIIMGLIWWDTRRRE